MPLRSLARAIALASLAALLPLTAPTTASAQGLIDFLWGGGQEWGGEKQSVAFDPKYTPDQIIVSFGDRRLYLVTAKGRATSYPIAVPREKSRWQGTTKITAKRENPSWRPTQEMLSENPKLPTWVPGGHPMNPLGVRALYLGTSAYRIHGTDAPWTIGKAVSQGCIRMFNKDVIDLYPRIPVGTRVTVTWERFTTQAVASSDSSEPSAASYSSGPLNYKRPAARPRIHTLPPLRQREDEVEDAQTSAITAAFTQPAPFTEDTPPLPIERAALPVKKSATTAATAKPAKPAKDKKVAKAVAKEIKPEAVTKQGSTNKLPAAAAIETANKTKAKPATAAKPETDAQADTDTSKAVEVAQRAAAAAARAAESARQAAEAAKKAAAAAKRATADTRASL
jgi:lipoprotein-anchoring transpeptidase ErfK/SrfK